MILSGIIAPRRDAKSNDLKALARQIREWIRSEQEEGTRLRCDRTALRDLESGELPLPYAMMFASPRADRKPAPGFYRDLIARLGPNLATQRILRFSWEFAPGGPYAYIPPDEAQELIIASAKSFLDASLIERFWIAGLDWELRK